MKKKFCNLLIVLLIIPLTFLFASCSFIIQDPAELEKQNAQTYIVEFDSNGGSHVNTIKNVEYNSLIQKPNNPTKNGYTFDGWYLDNKAWNFLLDKVTKDITLVAHWKSKSGDPIIDDSTETFTVQFNTNGGSLVDDLTYVKSGSTINAPIAPTKDGYIFDDWWIGNKCWNFLTDKVTDNITLVAHWKQKTIPEEPDPEEYKFSVTFDSQGGTYVPTLTDITSGSTITEPTAPTKTGFTFVGWYLENNTAWNFETDTVTDNITLFAHWQEEIIDTGDFSNEVTETNNKGSAEDPFYITDAESFVELLSTYGGVKKLVKQPTVDDDNNVIYEVLDGTTEPNHFKIVNNIDFTNKNYVTLFKKDCFVGVIDGNGKTIKNISINVSRTNLTDFVYKSKSEPKQYSARVALFGSTEEAVIENLTFENIKVNIDSNIIPYLKGITNNNFENDYNAPLVEFSVATIISCAQNTTLKINITSATITGSSYLVNKSGINAVGGVVAYASQSTITSNNSENANINVTFVAEEETRNYYLGGVAGYLVNSTISNLNVKTTITAVSVADTEDEGNVLYIGGIAGYVRGSNIENSTVDLTVNQTEEESISVEEGQDIDSKLYNKVGGIASIIKVDNENEKTKFSNVKINNAKIRMDCLYGGVVYEVKTTLYTAPSITTETPEEKSLIVVTFENLTINMNVRVLKVYGFGAYLYFTDIVYTSDFECATDNISDTQYNIRMTGSTIVKTVSGIGVQNPVFAAFSISTNYQSGTIHKTNSDIYFVYSSGIELGFAEKTSINFYAGHNQI